VRARISIPILLIVGPYLFAQTDASIPLRAGQGVQPIMSPLDVLTRALQARRLQLENQALQQQIQQQQIQQQQSQTNNAQPTPQAAPAPRQTGPDGMTLGFVNGRLWNGSSADMKLSYVIGIAEAISLTGGDMTRFLAKNLSAAEDSKAVDKFYEDPSNLLVPVSFALQITAMKANGGTPEAVENFTAGVRRAIFDLQSKSAP
jgi:hypothetical protein